MHLPIRKYVVVGSYPLNIRYSKDIDVICYEADIEAEYTRTDDFCGWFMYNDRRVECLFADKQESLAQVLSHHEENENAYLWELFAIKAGHIVFPHKQWDKHIHDYHLLKKLTYPGSDNWNMRIYDLIKLHRKCTKERLKIRTPKLKGVTKEEFFDDFVKKYYIHDDIHKAMAHKDKPMYEYMQHDTSKVECDKALWEAFSEEEKDWTVMEEAYVIALERHLIPKMKGEKVGLGEFEAFRWALMRICTTLCSGWFREWAVDNYYRILNKYNKKFVDKFVNYVTENGL